MKHTVETPYQEPLGGSESALSYLSEQLFRLGHEVFLFSRVPVRVKSRGIQCLSMEEMPLDLLSSLDVAVFLNAPLVGFQLRFNFGENTLVILWTQHAHDQPVVRDLKNPEVRDSFDNVVLLSQWQLDHYCRFFKIKREKCRIIGNAIAPAFGDLFSKKDILSYKKQPPVLAYTSTPFRGLDLLLKFFPDIRSQVPGTTLKVYSSMKVYQFSEKEDEEEYGQLYRLCKETEGIDYVGSLPQPKLAEELRSVMALTYPNTFAETSCIAVMEAMASGCQVITSEFGALPETTAGFAELISGEDSQEYGRRFIKGTVAMLKKSVGGEKERINRRLVRQIAYANKHYSWTARALEWDKWLGELTS